MDRLVSSHPHQLCSFHITRLAHAHPHPPRLAPVAPYVPCLPRALPLPQFRGMSSLQKMQLSGNYLQGQLPSQWGSMARLQTLWLSYNQLTGPLPPEWAGMMALQSLHLEGQQTGPLAIEAPPEWTTLTKLTDLVLLVS